jgi:hypothetical protein
MAKIGLWLELEVGIGFLVGPGLGSLTGQRTTTTVLLIALEIIVTPVLARVQIPYFIDGQRLVVGIAMDQHPADADLGHDLGDRRMDRRLVRPRRLADDHPRRLSRPAVTAPRLAARRDHGQSAR